MKKWFENWSYITRTDGSKIIRLPNVKHGEKEVCIEDVPADVFILTDWLICALEELTRLTKNSK